MQTLYEWEFRQHGQDAESLESICARNLGEFEKDADAAYVNKVVQGVASHFEEINALIVEAAPEWPLDQVSRIDRNVLRVAIYEMLFDPEEDVPPRVSINEAIEIGKTFGSDSSAKFVNGALGFVYRKFEERLKPRDAR